MLSYGDRLRFEATRDGERRVFVLKRPGSANGPPFKLYGYDTERNALNYLDGFDAERPTLAEIEDKTKGLIGQYVGDGWALRCIGGDVT